MVEAVERARALTTNTICSQRARVARGARAQANL